MGIGASIFLLALGAILTFGINMDSDAAGIFNINTIGIILMVIGGIGIVLSMMFWSSWGGPGGRREDRTVVRDRDVV